MDRTKPESTDQYIAGYPDDVQKLLNQIRAAIRKAAPDAEEAISYGIPAFHYKGYYLIYYAGYKNHVSVYPAPRENVEFKEQLSLYKGGKGTVQFPIDKPLPLTLITRIVKFRMKENEARADKKKK
jgi:uncharacterized protein YdhG (YjbR/CyaY superfamily)